MINRRSLLGGAAIGGGVLVIGGIAAREFLGGGRSSYISSGSVNPLQIPTLYPGKVEGGVRIFDLNLQRGTSPSVSTNLISAQHSKCMLATPFG